MIEYRDCLSRRQFVSGTAILATGLAGCSGSDNDSTGTTTGDEGTTTRMSETETDTAETQQTTEESTAGEATFTVTNIEAPEELAVGDSFQLSITVKNTGGTNGVWADTLYGKSGNSQWNEIGVIELEVPAGETKTWTSSEVTASYTGLYTFRLEETGREVEIRRVSAVLPYGEVYTAANGMAVTVNRVEFFDSYTWTGSSGSQYEETAPAGKKWARVFITAENTGNEQMYTPLSSDVSLIAGNKQYDSTYLSTEEGMFKGGEISPGIVREGWLAYEIPEGLAKSDFRVQWTGENFNGSWTVSWKASG